MASKLVLATSITHVLVSLGHTAKGLEIFAQPQWRSLPPLLRMYAKAGWYQGSVFFAITGVYTYQLSKWPSSTWTPIDRAIAVLTTLLYWGSSAWYFTNGDSGTGAVTGTAGALQAACLL